LTVRPHPQNPETHPVFETFFTRVWLDTFTLSLGNLLHTVFQHLPPPALASWEHDRVRALSPARVFSTAR
jgi:hypothetical protein